VLFFCIFLSVWIESVLVCAMDIGRRKNALVDALAHAMTKDRVVSDKLSEMSATP